MEYLSNVTVATKEMIIEETGVQIHDVRRMVNDKILTSSLNYNHKWLIHAKEIGKRADHWGVYRHRIEKYSRTVPTFHTTRTAKGTLSHLASRRPWGITAEESKELLGRDCQKVLDQLVACNAIQVRLCQGEKIYLNRRHKKADSQLKQRRTNPRYRKDDDDEIPEVGVITYEEFCGTFRDILSEMDVPLDVSDDRLNALVLMFTTSRTLRTTENWVRYNTRIQKAIGMPSPVDHTTLSRAFGEIDEDFLKKLFHKLVMMLHDRGQITNRFIVVDATHIYAYCDTRKNTNLHPVEGAEWGNHQGRFYGYKVHLLIDAESEMPLAMILSSGNDHDSSHFVPLLEEFDENYDFEEIIALLADGAYDDKDFRELVSDKTGGTFLPACNPRNSKILKGMKRRVKKLFDTHGHKIRSVQDAFKYLGQTFLTKFNINIGTSKESKLVELITERLHRSYRSAVERVFSRLKAMASFERPKSRRLESVIKSIWWCLIGYMVQALTAYDKGLPGSMRKRTMLV